MLDQILSWASLAASIATIVAIIFLIRQIQIGIQQVKLAAETLDVSVKQMRIAQSSLEEEREERTEQRRLLRETLWTALNTEITAILNSAASNFARFRPMNYGNPEEKDAFRDKDVKGEPAYNRSFVWTPIPVSTLEQIMGQMYLLGLRPNETETLHDLRHKILNFNSLAAAKNALLPNLVQGEVPSRQPSLKWHRWAEMEADQLNINLENGTHPIGNACKNIIRWLARTDDEHKTAFGESVLEAQEYHVEAQRNH